MMDDNELKLASASFVDTPLPNRLRAAPRLYSLFRSFNHGRLSAGWRTFLAVLSNEPGDDDGEANAHTA